LLALWLIRQNKGKIWGIQRQIPVAILIDPEGLNIQLRAPKVDWQPLHSGLLETGRRYTFVDQKTAPEDIRRFAEEVVGEATAVYQDTLLLTHAQNLGAVWPFLYNKNIAIDMLDFAAGEPIPIAKYSGLRHVRVRTADGDQTPQCYGVHQDHTGQPSGLWSFLPPRLFGSTGEKPATRSGAHKDTSKFVPVERGDKIFPARPNAQVWNPQFIEFFVAGLQDGDEPEYWAALAHELRYAAPYVKEPTILPWPLHLAEQVEEYLLPAAIAETEDEA
jgi:hypothetical protein